MVPGVPLEIVDDVLTTDPQPVAARDVQARQAGQPRRRMEVEAVVVVAPGDADYVGPLEDDDRSPLPLAGGGRRQAAGAGSDDDDVVRG